MTYRSVILGLMGVVTLCGITYFNDVVMVQRSLIGNHMPTSIYGGLFLFLLCVNPILFWVSKKMALSGKELTVIFAMILAACCIPASGLMKMLTAAPIAPHHLNRTQPGWAEQRLIEMTPEKMLVDVDFSRIVFRDNDRAGHRTSPDLIGKLLARDARSITIQDLDGNEHRIDASDVQQIQNVGQNRVLDGHLKGLPRENWNQPISIFDIPWYGWVQPLRFWLPVVGALWVSLIGLSLVVHRQWSDHEQLPYPLAQFTHALLPSEGQACGTVFRNRLFWIGTIPVLVIHLNNYMYTWYPDMLLRIPTVFNLDFLFESIPILWQAHFAGGINAVQGMMSLNVYFSVIAFAYFLPKDVSLSIGIGSYLFMWVAGISFSYGIWRSDFPYVPKIQNMLTCGAYVGMFLAIIYIGRYYYIQVLRRAFGLPIRDNIAPESVWGARLFLVGIAIFIGYLVWVGLDWQLAMLFAAGLVLIFLVMSRILAETGMYFIMPWWSPGVALLGLMGPKALSPKIILIMNLLATVLVLGYGVNPAREALMPYVVNALKLMDLQRVRIGRFCMLVVIALGIGLTVALPVTLYIQYNRGSLSIGDSNKYHLLAPPREAYRPVMRAKLVLTSQDNLGLSESLQGWRRFAHMRPDPLSVTCFGIGLGLVLLFTMARLRFPRFPLHPVLFLVWISGPGRAFGPSFLIGWLVKSIVTKYGGVAIYRKLTPMMFGMIGGELLGRVIPMAHGLIYFAMTGSFPRM